MTNAIMAAQGQGSLPGFNPSHFSGPSPLRGASLQSSGSMSSGHQGIGSDGAPSLRAVSVRSFTESP